MYINHPPRFWGLGSSFTTTNLWESYSSPTSTTISHLEVEISNMLMTNDVEKTLDHFMSHIASFSGFRVPKKKIHVGC